MAKAHFVFHGLFPDVVDTQGTPKKIIKVLFDVEFNQQFHSHLLADIEYMQEDGEYEVRTELPFCCPEFSSAAVQYYQYASGPQARKISHSGPKGPSLLTNNVIRAQWPIDLEASET